MKIARVERCQTGATSWATIDDEPACAHLLAGNVADWATEVLCGRPLPRQETVPLSEVRMLAPLEDRARVFGVGANYLSHVEKFGHDAPTDVVAYIKPESAMIGPEDTIAYPKVCTELDYEVELVAVVGLPMSTHDDPTRNLLGYTVGNDVSDRSSMHSPIGGYDLYGMKAQDRTTPVGPWIVTGDELGTGQPDLTLCLRVDGEERQRDVTSKMIFSIAEILAYLDARTALRPGDLIFTGTTCGVGAEDGRLLEPGAVVEAEVSGIGTLRNRVGPRST